MDTEALDKHRKAGKISAEALVYAKKIIKPGMLLLEATEKIEEKIFSLGGQLAFPTQISRNHIAAHYCAKPQDTTMLEEGDILKVDIGAHIDGYVSDTAITIDLGDHKELVKASKEALENAIRLVKAGVLVSDIGRAIQETITKYGFAPIRNLSGHGVGRWIVHQAPSIPNIDTGSKTMLEEGMIIAIEPFASTGAGLIYEQDDAEVFMLTGKRPVRNLITRNVLKDIEKLGGLPFCTRQLCKNNSPAKVNFALREIDQVGILQKFPPLPDKNKGLVSQHEHTIIVGEKKAEVITQIE